MSPPRSLAGRTLFVTGASRGIGLAIALRAARDGANVVVAAKTTEVNARLPGTIHAAATAIEQAGGHALAVACDVRDEAMVDAAIAAGVARFGGIDILVSNASAIGLTGTLATPMKRVDLMFAVNTRGTFLCAQRCMPHLLASAARGNNPQMLTLSPPLDMQPRWFGPHVAYSIAKYGMSMCVLGMAEEFRGRGVGINALWPRTAIATAALAMIPGIEAAQCRTPEIVADAAHAVLTRDARSSNGRFYIDDDVLREEGVHDFTRYAVDPGTPLRADLFVD
ncbi:MAG: NAD(P)-dependent oxidoreductase [Casimicrobiaceae bacterium]